MDELQDWSHVFRLSRGRFQKMGRPLFEYRVSDGEFEELTTLLRKRFGSPQWRIQEELVAPMFCLWAAEWWARKFEGGNWKWEPLLVELDILELAPGNAGYSTLQSLVEIGLKRWRRELKTDAGGNRQFLRTLALEGGLPLRLLVGERGDNLKRYLRALIGEMQRYADRLAPKDVAQRRDSYLPQSFRIAEVHELAAELVVKVRELQRQVGDAADPVAALDAQHPAWRQEFPLRVDDDVASALLTGLVREAAEVARRGSGTIRVVRGLRYSSSQRRWTMTAHLDFPARVSGQLFQSVFPMQSVPARFEFCVDSATAGTIVVARGYRRSSGEEAAYDLDPMPGAKDRLSGHSAQDAIGVLLRGAGEELFSSDLPGGPALAADVPWIFQAPADSEFLTVETMATEAGSPRRLASSQSLRLLATGSCALRTESAIVSLPISCRVDQNSDSTWDSLGKIDDSGRSVYFLKGRIRVLDADGCFFVCRTAVSAAEATESNEIQLRGRRVSLGRDAEAFWLGAPQIRELRMDQVALTTRDLVQWKPSDVPCEWRPYNEQCLGDVRLRVLGRDSAVRCRLRARILPAESAVAYIPSSNKDFGEIHFRGFRAQSIEMVATPNVNSEIAVVPAADTQALRLHAQADAPRSVTFTVAWSGARRVDLTLPFPTIAARFEDRRGRALAAEETIAATTLDHYCAFALAPNGQAAHFAVEGDAMGPGLDPAAAYEFALYETLTTVDGSNSWKLELSRLRRSIDLILDTSNAIDTACRLRLVASTPGVKPAVVNVRRYDLAAPEYTPELGPVLTLPEESCRRLEAGDYERLSLEAACFTDPERERVLLSLSGPGRWWIPESMMDGEPWIVLGWDGRWARMRPRVWTRSMGATQGLDEETDGNALDGPEETTIDTGAAAELSPPLPNSARTAARLSDLSRRKSAFRHVASAMAAVPNGEDWALFDHHLGIAAQVGPQCLELIQAVARTPDAAAYAAVRCGNEAALDQLWSTLEHLPFAWRLIPVDSWKRAFLTRVQLFANYGEDTRALLVSDFERMQRLFTDRARWLCPLIDQARATALRDGLSQDTQALKRGILGGYYARQLEELERELPTRESDRWPSSERVALLRGRMARDTRWPHQFNTAHPLGPWKDVLNTPTVAAACSIWGDLRPSLADVTSIRRLAAYDQDWFEQAYEAAFLFLCPTVLEDQPS